MKQSDSEASDIILEYLKRTNRPYSAIDVFNNLKEKTPKTLVVKLLNAMVENGKIAGKLYGKQWVYVARQDLLECPTQEEISKMDATIEALKVEISEVIGANKALESELSDLVSSLTDDQLEKEISDLELHVADLGNRLEKLQQGKIQVSEDEKVKVDTEYEKMRLHWKNRRKIFKSVWDTITEALPGSPKQFMEDLGIEDDESVGLDFSKNLL